MRILITNDDGIDAPGLAHLAWTVHSMGHEVVVAAPHQEASGASCSLTSVQEHGRTVIERRAWSTWTASASTVENEDVDDLGAGASVGDGESGIDVLAVVASPAFISLLALRRAFGDPPDAVVSGINEGPNTGRAVIHSGTVGAALTAATYGARGLAVSMELGPPHAWETARAFVEPVLTALLAAPAGTTINLNVPNRPIGEVRGLRPARLAPFGTVQTQVAESGDGFVKIAYTEPTEQAPADSDAALLAEGYATVTSLQATSEATSPATYDALVARSPFDRVT